MEDDGRANLVDDPGEDGALADVTAVMANAAAEVEKVVVPGVDPKTGN